VPADPVKSTVDMSKPYLMGSRYSDLVIPGWFHSHKLYEKVVAQADNSSVLVELGSYFGESTVYMARLLKERGIRPRFCAVDLWVWEDWMDGTSFPYGSKDKEQEHTAVAQRYPGDMDAVVRHYLRKYDVVDRVELIRSDSILAAADFEAESVDFVYTDTAHTYERVRGEIEAWLPKVKPGGMIAGDDVGRDHDQDGGVRRAVTEFFGSSWLTDGLTWYQTI
jgi:predicted O-methyltransferase YrrM